ncbi:MAG: hypothetical protein QOG22_2693, partial [Pseudonocardiales bacterium]|nr:hypothetical protein [Pseudonocardiales bacterium]
MTATLSFTVIWVSPEPFGPALAHGVSYCGQMSVTSIAAPASTELVDGIPAAARLHIVTGKGGTGKTTVA